MDPFHHPARERRLSDDRIALAHKVLSTTSLLDTHLGCLTLGCVTNDGRQLMVRPGVGGAQQVVGET